MLPDQELGRGARVRSHGEEASLLKAPSGRQARPGRGSSTDRPRSRSRTGFRSTPRGSQERSARPLTAKQIPHVGAAIHLPLSKSINPLFRHRAPLPNRVNTYFPSPKEHLTNQPPIAEKSATLSIVRTIRPRSRNRLTRICASSTFTVTVSKNWSTGCLRVASAAMASV